MTYTLEETIELARQAVEDRGADFVYPDEWRTDGTRQGWCRYAVIEDGQLTPACIVGHILDQVSLLNESYLLEEDPASNLTAVEDNFDYYARRFLDEIQGFQDRNFTWGDAVDRAKEFS